MLSKLIESRGFKRCYALIHKHFVFDVTALFYSGLSIVLILLYFYGQMYIINRLEFPESYFVGPGSFYDVVYLVGKNDHVITPAIFNSLFVIMPLLLIIGSMIRFKNRGQYFLGFVLIMSTSYVLLYDIVLTKRDYRFYPVNYLNMTSLVSGFILLMMLIYAGYLIYLQIKLSKEEDMTCIK